MTQEEYYRRLYDQIILTGGHGISRSRSDWYYAKGYEIPVAAKIEIRERSGYYGRKPYSDYQDQRRSNPEN